MASSASLPPHLRPSLETDLGGREVAGDHMGHRRLPIEVLLKPAPMSEKHRPQLDRRRVRVPIDVDGEIFEDGRGGRGVVCNFCILELPKRRCSEEGVV